MGRMVRGLVVVALLTGAGLLAAPTAEAGPPPEPTPYTCEETSSSGLVPDFAAELSVPVTASPASPKVFQPTTWTFDIDEPELTPPVDVNLDYIRVRAPIPANLTNVSAQLVAGAGETPNPALNLISLQQTATEIIVQLPATVGTNKIKAWTDGRLTYPSNILTSGAQIVLPRLKVTGTPTPAAGGLSIDWPAPTLEGQTVLLSQTITVSCTADGEPPPTIASTPVSTQRQLCDGRAVTVQLGFNAPTTGNDVIQGTNAADTTNGGNGADRFCGLNANDSFRGGLGNDRAVGGAGDDTLRGDAGDDRLQGDAGADNLQGGANRDTLIGGTQRDTCNGGPQQDTAQTCEVKVSIP